jgi:hypothetical protein
MFGLTHAILGDLGKAKPSGVFIRHTVWNCYRLAGVDCCELAMRPAAGNTVAGLQLRNL